MAAHDAKWTQELEDELIALLEEGIPQRVACDAVGIGKSTYYDWVARDDDYPSPGFAGRVTRARARGVINLMRSARKGGKGSHADLFVLERKHGWFKTERQEVDVKPPPLSVDEMVRRIDDRLKAEDGEDE